MKWFEITTEEEAQALKPYKMSPNDTPRVGARVVPANGAVFPAYWPEYPEADRLTFEQCMAIVRDDVTVEVMEELGGDMAWQTPTFSSGQKWTGFDIGDSVTIQRGDDNGVVELSVDLMELPNMTATKLRILVAILKGEKV